MTYFQDLIWVNNLSSKSNFVVPGVLTVHSVQNSTQYNGLLI